MNTKPDWFWLYRRLTVPNSDLAKIIPKFKLPRGDEEWVGPDGRKVKWREGWCGCWHELLDTFLPHVQVRGFQDSLSAQAMLAYQPESPKRWLAGIDDSTIPKRRAQPILDNRVEYYQFINDLCSWALNCTLKYCRYRMRWGEWSIEKRGKYCDRGDSFFFNRPESQRACKFLVGWFVRFANARRQFHSLIESKIKCPSHSQTRTAKSVQEIIADHVGRPAKLKMGKTANEDLWLILTWPIVVFHHWTYKDVVRAVRLHFGHGHLQRPVPSMTPQEAAQAIENWSERNAPRSHFWKPSWMTRETAKAIEHFTEWQRPIKPVEKYMPKAATEWRVEAMKVSDADAEVMRLRCNRLHLDKLNPKRRDIASEPRFFGLVNVFHATD